MKYIGQSIGQFKKQRRGKPCKSGICGTSSDGLKTPSFLDENSGKSRVASKSGSDDEASCVLEVSISNEGMQVSVTQTAYDSWLVLDGYYEKISSFDPNSVS
ncbi:MAG: hypothetical protein LUG93_18705 [Lachnospiraceae bacterium]|nr:hypothetical protein [Lachnospiraceae bacterium]